LVSRFAYPGGAGQLRGAIAPLGASAPSQIQPGPGNVLTMADGTTHVAPGFRQPAPGYGLNPYSYVAPHLMPARQPQPQQYPGYLSLRSPAPQGRPQFQGAAYLQGAAQPYPGMYGDDGCQGFPPPPRNLCRGIFAGVLAAAAAAATDGRHAAADFSGCPPIFPAGKQRRYGTLERPELLAHNASRLRAWSFLFLTDRIDLHR
jgi:hypothetical protein